MCGIAGIMTLTGAAPDAAALDRLRDALRHRGPDGEGRYVRDGVGLVQTRLAIIDLETGDQPLHGPAGTALVANGEIYNYRELRAAMPAVAFATRSDCEPPLYLYRDQGRSYAAALRGMYVIALHDGATGRLLLSRDPFGIKPLYMADTRAGFAFASEPQALVAAGLVEPKVAAAERSELLQLQFTTGRETIYEGITRLLPGETVELTGGRIVERRRDEALPSGGPEGWSEDEALRRIESALVDSVTVHQRSDVPYGMFLSGGVDSSALLALMARLNDRPVEAYTIGFTGMGVHDERDHAAALCREVGAQHHAVEFSEQDFWSLLPRVAACMDDPVADYAVLPTWKLAREAAKDLKVVLCGEGGDELFAGYGRYRSALRPWWQGGRVIRPRGIMDGLDILRDAPTGWRDGIAAAEARATQPGRTRLQVAQAVDCADWLPNDLLAKVDRCLMAHGLEGRTPFLDPAVAGVAFRLGDRQKVHKGMGKYLLRKWLEQTLPAALPFSRKRGFTVPVGEWIAARGASLGPLVARQPGVAEVARPDRVEALFRARGKHEGQAAWTLLFYALWHNANILRRRADGDVEAVLAAG
jgi:asparagine synthase (glutamine-hydrolysing)